MRPMDGQIATVSNVPDGGAGHIRIQRQTFLKVFVDQA